MPGETFFQYLDAAGVLHIVDGLEKVPAEVRAQAQKVELASSEAAPLKEALGQLEHLRAEAKDVQGRVQAIAGDRSIEPVSFGLGFASALVVAALLWAVRGTAKLAFKLAVLGVLGLLAAGLYFGYVRRSAGLSEDLLSDPRRLVEDAKEAAERLDARQKSAEKVLP